MIHLLGKIRFLFLEYILDNLCLERIYKVSPENAANAIHTYEDILPLDNKLYWVVLTEYVMKNTNYEKEMPHCSLTNKSAFIINEMAKTNLDTE